MTIESDGKTMPKWAMADPLKIKPKVNANPSANAPLIFSLLLAPTRSGGAENKKATRSGRLLGGLAFVAIKSEKVFETLRVELRAHVVHPISNALWTVNRKPNRLPPGGAAVDLMV
jgi:hypothetical protein